MGKYTTHTDLSGYGGRSANMDALRARLSGFREAANSDRNPLQVDIHLANPSAKESKEFIRNIVVAAALVIATSAATVGLLSDKSDAAAQGSAAPASDEIEPMQATSYELTPGALDTVGPGLRAPHVKFVQIRYAGREAKIPDPKSRIELAKYAARQANLKEVGLDWRDVYGLIHAESSWVDRPGMGKNGVQSHGLSQFEPGTAKSMGLKNAGDPVEAIQMTANLMKIGALWAKERISESNLNADQVDKAIRTGVSVYYNLSWKARHKWDPSENVSALPKATQHHIQNTVHGRLIAQEVHIQTLGVEWIDPATRQAAPAQVVEVKESKPRKLSFSSLFGLDKSHIQDETKLKNMKPA